MCLLWKVWITSFRNCSPVSLFFWGRGVSFVRKVLGDRPPLWVCKPWKIKCNSVSWKYTDVLRRETFSIPRCSCFWKWLWGLGVQCGDDGTWGGSFRGVPRAGARVHGGQPASRNCVSLQGEGSEWRRGEYTVMHHYQNIRFCLLTFLPSCSSSAVPIQPWQKVKNPSELIRWLWFYIDPTLEILVLLSYHSINRAQD